MSLAIPTRDKLTKEEWEKLVCALFTGVKLYGFQNQLMLPAAVDSRSDESILNIIQENTKWVLTEQTENSDYIYLPYVTVLYQENHQGVITGELLLRNNSQHAEEQFLSKNQEHLCSVHSIGLNFSPCTGKCANAIVKKYTRSEEREALPKPVINFAWVHNHPKGTPHGRDGVKLLIKNGFNLKVWETTRVVHYLLDQAPSDELKTELQLVYDSMSLAFSERDMETQERIEEARREVYSEGQRRTRKRTALSLKEATHKRATLQRDETDDEDSTED